MHHVMCANRCTSSAATCQPARCMILEDRTNPRHANTTSRATTINAVRGHLHDADMIPGIHKGRLATRMFEGRHDPRIIISNDRIIGRQTHLMHDEVRVSLLQHPRKAGVALRQKMRDAHRRLRGPSA